MESSIVTLMTEKFEKLLQLRTQEKITNMERNHEKVVVSLKKSVEDLRREVKKIQEAQNCLRSMMTYLGVSN